MKFSVMATKPGNPYEDVPYSVDFETLKLVQSMTKDIVGVLLGITAGIIIIGMFIITALDIAYITIPPLQSYARGKNWDGTLYNGKKFRLISKCAVQAVQQGCTGEKSSISIYFVLRLKSYIIAAVVLFIIIGGSQTIVDVVAYLLSGLLKALKIV